MMFLFRWDSEAGMVMRWVFGATTQKGNENWWSLVEVFVVLYNSCEVAF